MKTLIKILCLSVLWFSCESSTEPQDVHGCLDSQACNYNPNANIDNNSCIYEIDCNGECGGDALLDNCDVCDNDTSNDCELDECGVWGGDGIADGACDCDGNVLDDCAVCGGDGTYCLPIEVTFGNINMNDENQINVEILIDTPQNINAFQFYLYDSESTQILSAEGGLAENYNFSIIVGPESENPNLILGFSYIADDVIPSESNGVLTNLTLTTSNTDLCFEFGNEMFIKMVDTSNWVEQLLDELDGNIDGVIEYQVNFGDCISLP